MNQENKSRYYAIAFIVVCSSIYGYGLFRNYEIQNCQKEFGFAYNARRKALGIPIIPVNWHVKERAKQYIWWTGDENGVGHSRKTIAFSDCNILSEHDVYKLADQNGKARLLEIECIYGNGNEPGAIIAYTYQIEHSAQQISKRAADSLLEAEHIK